MTAEASTGPLTFGLLGPLQVEVAGRPVELAGGRLKSLLVLLLVHANAVVAADRLIEDLWSGRPTPGAAATLQGYVSELRRVLARATGGAAPIVTRRPGYLLNVEVERFDILRFEGLLGAVRAMSGDVERRAQLLGDALSLWRGPALADVVDEPFARPIAARLEELRLWALQERLEADLERGLHAAVVAELGELVTEHPLQERFWGQWMLALYRCGRQADALRAYQDLRRRLDDDLGIGPSPALQGLEAAILAQEPSLQPAATALRTPTVPEPPGASEGGARLRPPQRPAPLTRFIGRTRELPEVRELLGGTRLLSLIGAGGSGKTRLAVQVALEESDRFPGGTPFVDLATISEPAEVTGAVGAAVGLGTYGDITVDALCERLASEAILLVLDNCEHLLDACAEVVDAVLSRCPRVVIVVTSQEELRVGGETVWRVPPMSLPVLDRAATPDDILSSDAVQLFCDRAASALPKLTLRGHALQDVARVCWRLDGIPLAIELAAALVAIFPVAEIVQRLDDRFALLTRGNRRALARQRTLRAAVDWSFELLEEPERRMFARLSVFVGQFSIEAAEAVSLDDEDFLETLSALVSKSMLVAVNEPSGYRYRLLETLRQYGLEQLRHTGEESSARRRHAEYYVKLAEAVDEQLHTGHVTDWEASVVRELPNLQGALEFLFSSGDLENGVRLAGALRWWFRRMGPLRPAREWLQHVLQRRQELSPPSLVKALTAAMAVSISQGDYRWTSEIGDDAVAQAEALDDRRELSMALMARGAAAVFEGKRERALGCLDRSVALCQELGDRWGEGWALTYRAIVTRRDGHLRLARTQLEAALSIFRDLHDDYDQVVPLMQLAILAEFGGDEHEAARCGLEAVDLATRLGDRQLRHVARSMFGRIELAQGRRDEAHRLLVSSLREARGVEHQFMVAIAVEGLAMILHEDERHEDAAKLWGFADELRERSASPPTTDRIRQREVHLDAARAALGGEAIDREFSTGRLLSFDQMMRLIEQS